MRRAFLVALALSTTAGLAACGSDGDSAEPRSGGGTSQRTLKVPGDYRTIQAAVDAAQPGDLVLIAPGTYKEGVKVETEDVVLRGEDRNTVIVDGEFERENGIMIFSNGVAVENLTVRNNTKNGVFFTGDYGKGFRLSGYRASYVTAYNNGLYGLYAFNAKKGVFENSYGSGHPDSAFYVGQCNPCDALLTGLVAEANMLGYSGTNSTGVTIVRSTFRNNRAGIVPNSLYSEKLYPNRGSTIVGNVVEANQNPQAPSNASFAIAWGNGILAAGTSNTVIERNLVRGHVNAGIVVTDLPSSVNPETKEDETFKPENNTVRDNTASGNTFDLAYLTVNYASRPFGNCFEANRVSKTFPDGLQDKMGCTPGNDVDLGDLSGILASIQSPAPDVDWKAVAPPPPQPNMPDARTAPAKPARNLRTTVDLAAITTPSA